jgi:hypothetical protein
MMYRIRVEQLGKRPLGRQLSAPFVAGKRRPG